MCQACCDLTRVEQTAAPNCLNIPTNGSVDVTTTRDALVIVTSFTSSYTGVRLSAARVDQADSADTGCQFRIQGGASIFLPGRGSWRIYASGGMAGVKAVVVETYCGAAFQAYARQGYGVPTHSVVTLDSTPASTLVIAENQRRAYLCLVNDSDTTVYLAFGPAASANSGIRLNANGGSYEMSGSNVWRGKINGILASAGAGKKVLVTEGD